MGISRTSSPLFISVPLHIADHSTVPLLRPLYLRPCVLVCLSKIAEMILINYSPSAEWFWKTYMGIGTKQYNDLSEDTLYI